MLHMPFSSTQQVKITQATNDKSISHFGKSGTGLDFDLSRDDPVYAMADGVVYAIYNEAVDHTSQNTVDDKLQTYPDATDSVGLSGYGNFVTVLHTVTIGNFAFAFYATYAHLEQDSMSSLQVGDPVIGGVTQIGEVGWTGKIIGDHLHVQVGMDTFTPTGSGGTTLPNSGYAYADGSLTPENLTLIDALIFSTGTGQTVAYDDIKKYQSYTSDSGDSGASGPPDFAITHVPGQVAPPSGPLAVGGDESFEDGDLSVWQVLGQASVGDAFDFDQDLNVSDGVTTASDGKIFAALDSGGAASAAEIEAFFSLAAGQLTGTTGTAMKTTITLAANEDSIYFDWYFDAADYLPFNDSAYAVIDGRLLKLSDVAAVGDYGDSGWMNTGFTGLAKGSHEIGFIVIDELDTILNSGLYVDDIVIA